MSLGAFAAFALLSVAVIVQALWIEQLRRTLAAHERHLTALDASVGDHSRHLAAHDGLIQLTRQEVNR